MHEEMVGGGTTQVDETERYERNESSPRFMPRLNNQRAGYRRCLDPRGKSVHPSTLFSFFFYFLASKVCCLLTEIPINHFSQTNARKASNFNKFYVYGTCIVVAYAFE